ncbi:LysR family transcriptional regulator [Actinokineospora bangkokensis]|uniref:HTH lysR-type domain-containing protein n=1 Tax=Actinokineospora bangkokensis TaxID=1193682 RepID=A0A1Q9LJ36_9PSEU|nr:LysR family transcriptional regulator [Actinokineospora bangkokensis]OLR92023.1 hypothetical protein BJP25_24125 [Actinokineospora bangkokensis]
MDIEVRHARVVVALAETGSITRASVRLALPQPSVSAQLRRIERTVGGALFVRSRTGIEPTALGERLIPMMAELAAHADAIVERIDDAAAGAVAGAVVRVGNVEWTPFGLQQSIVAALPGVGVRTETLDSPSGAIAAIARGQLDAALVCGGRVDLGAWGERVDLVAATVISEPVWVAVPPSSPAPVDAAALRAMRWVRRVRDHGFHPIEEDFFSGPLGFEPEVVHRVAGHAEAMSWVREAGVAALATPTAASPDVELVAPALGQAHEDLVLVSRRGALGRKPLTRLVRAVRDYYCEYARLFPGYWAWLTHHLGQVLPAGS